MYIINYTQPLTEAEKVVRAHITYLLYNVYKKVAQVIDETQKDFCDQDTVYPWKN